MSRTLKGLGGPAPVSPRLSPLGTPARGAVRASEICDLAWAVGQKIVSLRDVPHASLAVVFDVVSGVLLGRAFAREPSSAASEAWRDAVSRRRPPHVCLFHDFVGEPFTDRAFRAMVERQGDVLIPRDGRFSARHAVDNVLRRCFGESSCERTEADWRRELSESTSLQPGCRVDSSAPTHRLVHDLCRLVGTSVDVYAQQEKVDLQLRRNEERARLKGDRAEELRWRRERRVEPRE